VGQASPKLESIQSLIELCNNGGMAGEFIARKLLAGALAVCNVSFVGTLAAAAGSTKHAESMDVLRFPTEQSMGKLLLVHMNELMVPIGDRKVFGEARGTVAVPRSSQLVLAVSYFGSKNLPLLASVHSDCLVSVDLRNLDEVGDEAFKCLSKVSSLRSIVADHTDVTDRGVEYLRSLPNLTMISLGSTLISGASLKTIAGFPSLKKLSIGSTQVDDKSLAYLQAAHKLKELRISGSGIGDEGLKNIAGIKSLVELDASSNQRITDKGVVYLVALPKLDSMSLSETNITGRSLQLMMKMPALTIIHVTRGVFSTSDLNAAKGARFRIDEHGRMRDPRLPVDMFSPLH
jgi:hypothetical protein